MVAVDVGNGKWGGCIEKPVRIGTSATTSGGTHEIFPYVQKGTGKVYLFLGDESVSREGRVWEGAAYMQDLFGDTPKRGGVPQTSAGYTHIIDFTDPAHPKNIAKYHQEEFGAHDIIVEDDVMYQAYYDGGVLMFGVGLHFSLNDLLAVKRIAVPGAVVQMGLATLLGMLMAWWWGWHWGSGLIFGLSLSCASTVVLLKALEYGVCSTR